MIPLRPRLRSSKLAVSEPLSAQDRTAIDASSADHLQNAGGEPSLPSEHAVPCIQCGYDLRAHPPESRCPECGHPVAESVAARRQALRQWDVAVAQGLDLLAIAAGIAGVLMIVFFPFVGLGWMIGVGPAFLDLGGCVSCSALLAAVPALAGLFFLSVRPHLEAAAGVLLSGWPRPRTVRGVVLALPLLGLLVFGGVLTPGAGRVSALVYGALAVAWGGVTVAVTGRYLQRVLVVTQAAAAERRRLMRTAAATLLALALCFVALGAPIERLGQPWLTATVHFVALISGAVLAVMLLWLRKGLTAAARHVEAHQRAAFLAPPRR